MPTGVDRCLHVRHGFARVVCDDPSVPRSRTTPATNGDADADLLGGLRDRIVDFKRVPSNELHDNPANWRVHPYAQTAAITELLDSVGIAGALTAYYSERNGGNLTLIDGHERRGHQADWPTLILDINDDEADLLLLTLDPVAGMADAAPAELTALLSTTHPGVPALEDLLQELGQQLTEDGVAPTPGMTSTTDPTTGSMGLQHFEHYDYVVVLARNSHDWLALQDMLGIERVEYRLKDGRSQFGLGRVIDASALLEKLRAL